MMRRIFAIISALAVAVTATACGSTEPRSLVRSVDSGHVILGTKYDQPGLGMRNPDKTMTGLDVEVATYVVNHIADQRGVAHPEITWRETPSATRETVIKNGEVDMIAGTYSINASRAKSVNFGGPYLLTHQALLVRGDDTSLTSLQDLDKGKKLCSVTGSTPAQKVKKSLPGVQLQEYDSYSSCVEALHQKKVDAMTTDATILYGFALQYPGEFEVIEMTKEDGKPFTNEHYGLGLAKDDAESTEAINDAVRAMQDDGSFQAMVDKNLGENASVVEADEAGNLDFVKE